MCPGAVAPLPQAAVYPGVYGSNGRTPQPGEWPTEGRVRPRAPRPLESGPDRGVPLTLRRVWAGGPNGWGATQAGVAQRRLQTGGPRRRSPRGSAGSPRVPFPAGFGRSSRKALG